MNRLLAKRLTRNRRARRQAAGMRARKTLGGIGLSFSTLLAFFLLLITGLIAWQAVGVLRNLPDAHSLAAVMDPRTGSFAAPTRFYDRTGETLLAELSTAGSDFGSAVSPGELNPDSPLVQAMLAAYQPDYRDGPAFRVDNLSPEIHGTIPQRVVYEALLNSQPATLSRAITERVLAQQIIATYGSKQVLEWFLRLLPFGNGLYGVEQASAAYFGVPAADLDAAQAAMLTGISLAPALNPWNSAAGAVSLQQQVLRQLAALGLLSDAELQAALLEEVRVLPEPTDSKPRTEFVQNALQEAEKKYGEDRVNRGGMVIRTAQDSYQQGQADCLTTSLRGMVEGSGESVTCQAAVELPLLPPFQPLPSGSLSYELVVLDPASGEVLALAQAGAESSTQPAALGSLVTPFIYLNAFAEGSGPASLVWDVTGNPIDAPWQDADELGPESARAALNRDDLAPAAQMLLTGGDASMSRLASLLGFTSDVGGDPLAYSGGITAAARAYAMLANSGQIPAAASFLTTDESIDTGGAGDEAALAVVSRQLAYLVSDSLSDLAERTAAAKLAVRASGNESLAVKIGSVGNGTAAWAVVYSPGRVILTRISGVNLADGARVDENWAAALAGAMEQAASLRQPAKTWQEPAGISRVVVCVPAGLLPGLDCQQQRAEIFLAGNEPVNLDNLYQSAEVNRENGLLATVFTPPELTQQQRFLNVPPEYQAWADSQYLPPLPHEYDTAQPPAPADGTVIRLPEMYATVNGEVSITGDAFGDAFASYRLDYGQGLNPLTWVQIGQNGTEPMQGELLAVWDTAGLQGLYTLRLQVLGADARLQEHMVVVTVRP